MNEKGLFVTWLTLAASATILAGTYHYMVTMSAITASTNINGAASSIYGSTATNNTEYESDVICHVGTPCAFPEKVDIRFIILTYNRHESLQLTLNSLRGILLDGDKAALEVFVDRSKSGRVDRQTVDTASQFDWPHGIYRIHIREKHAGIYGQWIDTWRPPETEVMDELAVIIEDDIILSPFAYRWLRQVHRRQGHKTFISGYCLQDSNVVAVRGWPLEISHLKRNKVKNSPAYFFRVAGSWALAPHPVQWRKFQDWFHTEAKKIQHPYVQDAELNTKWYKDLEKHGRSDTMWTMWFIYFTDKFNLSALISNIPLYSGNMNNSLVCNRREAGLHYRRGEEAECNGQLMKQWSEGCADIDKIPAFSYDSSFVGTM